MNAHQINVRLAMIRGLAPEAAARVAIGEATYSAKPEPPIHKSAMNHRSIRMGTNR